MQIHGRPALAPSLDSSLWRVLSGLPAAAPARRHGVCTSPYCPALLQGTSLNPYSFSIYSLTSELRSFCQVNIYQAPLFLSSYTSHSKEARPEMQPDTADLHPENYRRSGFHPLTQPVLSLQPLPFFLPPLQRCQGALPSTPIDTLA